MAKKKAENTGRKLFVVACLIFFLTLLFRGSFYPFVGVNAWNFNTYSQIAKNYVLFGYPQTFLAPITSVSETLPANPQYYLHHPQLISIAQALFFNIFSESFFVARVPVIIASLISAVLIYKIAYEFKGRKYAALCLVAAILIPGLSIFGRMIGQEALVLMFTLSTSYFFIRYAKTKSNFLASLAVLSVVLGTLSDWPMTYFIVFFAAFALKTRAKKLYPTLLLTSFVTAVVFLLYIFALNSGFSDLATAFLVRSPGEVTTQSNWYLSWITTILLRIFIYIGPLIFTAGILGSIQSIRGRNKDKSNIFYFILTFLLFGLFHVVLYPEGSFGHAYWIFYLIPFFVFSSGIFVSGLTKHKLVLIAAVVVSLVYLLMIVHWKTGETRGNIFRYMLATVASHHIEPYEDVLINSQSVVDPDLYEYAFDLRVSRADSLAAGKTAIFTCSPSCGGFEGLEGIKGGKITRITSPEATGIIYDPIDPVKNPDKINIIYKPANESGGLSSHIYSSLMEKLRFPQL